MDPARIRLLDVIRRRYANVCYTHKAHEKERERASKRVRLEKWIRIGLTFIAALTISVEAASSQNLGAILAAVVGAISLAYSIYRLATSPESRVHSHTIAAKQLKAERDNFENLIEECMSRDFSTADIRAKRDAIEQRINAMDLPTPYTSNKAYEEANDALSIQGGEVASKSEIDNLLPEGLRLADTEGKSSEKLQDSPETGNSEIIGFA